jgi:hypothetical protein
VFIHSEKAYLIRPSGAVTSQTPLHRIAHHQRADERRTTDGGPEHDAQVRTPVKAQTAADERAESHFSANIQRSANYQSC